MSRSQLSPSLFLLFAVASSPALADKPVVLDRDSMMTQLQNLSTSLGNLQQHAQVVATQPGNSQASRASVAALQSGLQQVTQQMKSLDEQVRRAGAPVAAACPPCPVQQQIAQCPPPPDCSVVQQPIRRDRRGFCPPPPLCPPPVQCPPQVACAPCAQCPGPVVVAQMPGPGPDRDRWREQERERERQQRREEHQRREQQNQPPPGPMPIDPNSLGQLLGAVNAEAFSADKLRVLNDGSAGQYFTVDQTIEVVNAFTFSADKLGALRTVAPRILDRQNQYKIYGAFTFSGDKEEAKRILGGP